jgi:hypothetical protein
MRCSYTIPIIVGSSLQSALGCAFWCQTREEVRDVGVNKGKDKNDTGSVADRLQLYCDHRSNRTGSPNSQLQVPVCMKLSVVL